MSKEERYQQLIEKARNTIFGSPDEIISPHSLLDIPLQHVEPYAQWHGSLNAQIMVVGQDFADCDTYTNKQGIAESFEKQTTNRILNNLFEASFNISLGDPYNPNRDEKRIFLTNAVMGLKKGKLNTPLKAEWINNSRPLLIELIKIIEPSIIITLGRVAYQSLRQEFNLLPRYTKMTELVRVPLDDRFKINLNGKDTHVCPVFHTGRQAMARRKYENQLDDWKRIKPFFRN